jgi:ubiquinone/menaquinone biosynthesis C-methylase UbiE
VVRDQILDRAALHPGDVLLDVGAGDGLIGFGAVERVSPGGRVIFSDVSADLMEVCRGLARSLGVDERCGFVIAGAEDLAPLDPLSVDVVTTRAVLIYVHSKPTAFAEFFRVLRPGGRISVYEPINRLMFPEPRGQFWGYDVGPIRDLADKVKASWNDDPERDSTLMDFDERDLFDYAEDAGFGEIHLELRREVTGRHEPTSWEAFVATSPNPLAPSQGEVIGRALDTVEQLRFETYLRPLVEAGVRTRRRTVAHLWAQKPS